MKTLIFEEGTDELDTFESFYENIFFADSSVLIPQINVGVCEHPLNPLPLSNLKFLNQCYLYFEDVAIIIKNGNLIFNSSFPKGNSYKVIHSGGINIEQEVGDSLEIFCKKAFLQVKEDYKLNDSFWYSDIKSVHESEQAKQFLNLGDIPENLASFVWNKLK